MTQDDAELSGLTIYRLRLFIAGVTPRSSRTIETIQRICADHLSGRFDLEIIDIYQQPELAAAGQVVAAPTLLKMAPLPSRRIIGDLSDEVRVMHALDLRIACAPPREIVPERR